MANYKMLPLVFLLTIFSVLPIINGLGRIVGGNETTIERRPYQASLQFHRDEKTHHSCGASIISTKFLITAAHCNPGSENLEDLWARVGSTTYNEGGQVLKVYTFKSHPMYDRSILDYDFALVGFEDGTEITLGPHAAIVPLTEHNDPADSSIATVSGWGRTNETIPGGSINLKEVDLPIVNDMVCRKNFPFLTPRQMCLGGTSKGGESACFGDSGGPVVQNGVQYALVSGGKTCEKPNIPGVYARISSAREWIKKETGI